MVCREIFRQVKCKQKLTDFLASSYTHVNKRLRGLFIWISCEISPLKRETYFKYFQLKRVQWSKANSVKYSWGDFCRSSCFYVLTRYITCRARCVGYNFGQTFRGTGGCEITWEKYFSDATRTKKYVLIVYKAEANNKERKECTTRRCQSRHISRKRSKS